MSLGPGRILWINDLSNRIRTRDLGLGILEVGFLTTVSRELYKYKLDLVRVQEVRWEGSGTEPTGEYIFFSRKGNENYELGTGFFVHKRIISTASYSTSIIFYLH
jgi:hypothetical protein